MKSKTPTPEKKLKHWQCSKCKGTFHPVQMELQPKLCPGCGQAQLKEVYE